MSRDLTIFELDTSGDRNRKNEYEETIANAAWVCRKFATPLFQTVECAFYQYVEFIAPTHLPEMRRILGEDDELVGSAWRYDSSDRLCDITTFSAEKLDAIGTAELLPILFFLDQKIRDQFYVTASGNLIVRDFDLADPTAYMLDRSPLLSIIMSHLKSPRLAEYRDFRKRSFLAFLTIVLLSRSFLESIFHDDEKEEFLFERKLLLEEKLYKDDLYNEVIFQLTAEELIVFFENFHAKSIAHFHFENEEEKYTYLQTTFVRYFHFCMKFLLDKINAVIDQIAWHLESISAEKISSDINMEKCSETFLVLALRNFLITLTSEIGVGNLDWAKLKGIAKKMQLLDELYSKMPIIESSQLHEPNGFIARLRKIVKMVYAQLSLHDHFFKPEQMVQEEKITTAVHVRRFSVLRFYSAFFDWLQKTRERNRQNELVNHARLISIFDFSDAQVKKNHTGAVDEVAMSALREMMHAVKNPEDMRHFIQVMFSIDAENLLRFKHYFSRLLCDVVLRETRMKEDVFFMLEQAMPATLCMRHFAQSCFPKLDEEEAAACRLLIKLYPDGHYNSSLLIPEYFTEIEKRRAAREDNLEGGWVLLHTAAQEVQNHSSRFRFSLDSMRNIATTTGGTASVLAMDAAAVAGNAAVNAAATATTYVSGWLPKFR